jgi:hypothetical protein
MYRRSCLTYDQIKDIVLKVNLSKQTSRFFLDIEVLFGLVVNYILLFNFQDFRRGNFMNQKQEILSRNINAPI